MQIKRTPISAYKNIRKAGLIAINLEEGDELAWVQDTDGSDELIIATAKGMAIRFAETDLRPLGRTAMGVRALRLEEEDQVVGMAKASEAGLLLTITESGLGRRTPMKDYRLQSRGGKGVRNYHAEGKETRIAAVRQAEDGEDIILISDDGVIIRIPAEQINIQSRYAGGVRVMRIAEGGRVVSVASAPRAEEEPEETAPQEAAGEQQEAGGEEG